MSIYSFSKHVYDGLHVFTLSQSSGKLVPLFCGPCFQTSATFDQLWSETIQWKNPETNDSYIFKCVQVWVALGPYALYLLSRGVQCVHDVHPPSVIQYYLLA